MEDQDLEEGGVSTEEESEETTVPIERWNDMYGKHKTMEAKFEEYSELGEIDSVKEKLGRLKTYDKQVSEYREKQAVTPEQQAAEQSSAETRRQLEELYPSLKKLDRLDELEDMREYREQQVLSQASSHLGSLLKTSGVDVDSDTQDDVEDFLLSKMSDSERKSVVSGNFEVIGKVLERVKGSRLLKSIMATSDDSDNSEKAPAQTAPKRHKSGGQGMQKKSTKPLTLKETEDRAWAMLENSS